MNTQTITERASIVLGKLSETIIGTRDSTDSIRVLWLSAILFFTVGGYWLLRSIKDPIISIIDGVYNHLCYLLL